MAWNNNYNRNSYGYQNSYGRNSGYNQGGYNNRYSSNSRQKKKRSGARLISTKDGTQFISAWHVTRFGLMSYTANFWKKVESQNGRTWEVWVINILNKDTGAKTTVCGLLDPQTMKLTNDQLNLIISPKAPNGGYCGRRFSKR